MNASKQLNPDAIVENKRMIRPTLDWVDDQLIVGVELTNGPQAVLSSTQGLIRLADLKIAWDKGVKLDSPVNADIAEKLIQYLGEGSQNATEDEAKALIQRLAGHLEKFVVFPDRYWPDVLAVWVLGTYLYPMFQAYPYLWVTSSEPGCGKSLLGQIIAHITFKGEFLTSPSEANLFRLAELTGGVQVWDEVELTEHAEKKRFDVIKAVLLSGYRNGGHVIRQTGTQYQNTTKYNVYCPRVLIGLSTLPETSLQRTIPLHLIKRKQDQDVQHYRIHDQETEERNLRDSCLMFAFKCAERVNQAYVDRRFIKKLEKLLGNVGRDVDDIWLPIFAVAATTSVNRNNGLSESHLFNTLIQAAGEVHVYRKSLSTSALNSNTTQTGNAVTKQADACFDERKLLVCACEILAWSGPVEPTDLVNMIREGRRVNITTQWLSKKLSRLGIKASKHGGRRVFIVAQKQIQEAKRKLGGGS